MYRITKASTLEYKYNMHLHSDMHALMPITFVSNDACLPFGHRSTLIRHINPMQAYESSNTLSHVQIYNQSLV